MPQISGGCLCGKVRYETQAEPVFMGICHCRNCQKQAGSAFGISVAVPKQAFSIKGTLKTYVDKGDSGKAVNRRFCPDCGSPIITEAEVLPRYCDHKGWYSGRYLMAEADDGDLLRQSSAMVAARREHAALSEEPPSH